METRKPKKGEGVPKETPARNSIAALESILVQHFPGQSWKGLKRELEKRNFFAAGMQEQVRLMAQLAVELAESQRNEAALIAALSASPAEKIRGVAAFVIPILYPDNLKKQLEWLHFTGALEGTWPRELSATILHNLIIRHGVTAVFPLVREWIKHENPAVRRLATEAFRPRGVMLAHINDLKEDPSPLKTILEPLLDDPSDYVQKSVANNLNDISKDNPGIILEWTKEWNTPDATKQRHWILARALRTLIDEGHPAALKLLGYGTNSNLKVTWQNNTPRRIKINQFLPCDVEIVNLNESETGAVVLLLMDEPGKSTARRKSTYQIWKGKIKAGETKSVIKRIHFVDKNSQPRVEGLYRLSVTINGKKLEEREMIFKC
ncbi:DNA alkylation repair protein [candidate division KSB1 bacterium]|nr:DNA alkylation repair protein [candidate division KSB1 bacterium]